MIRRPRNPILIDVNFELLVSAQKGPRLFVNSPKIDVGEKIIAISRRAIRLFFYLIARKPMAEMICYFPSTISTVANMAAKDGCSSQSFRLLRDSTILTAMKETSIALAQKKGTLADASPAHEFNRLYTNLEHAGWGPIDPAPLLPF